MFEPDNLSAAAFGESVRRSLHRRELAATRHRAAIARSFNVTGREMLAIGFLAQRGALAPAALGSLLDLSSAGVTALVQRMERAGLLIREQHPSDRRSVLVRLTPTFVERAERTLEPLVSELQRLAEEVPIDHRPALARFLSRVALATEEEANRVEHGLESPCRAATALPRPGLWG